MSAPIPSKRQTARKRRGPAPRLKGDIPTPVASFDKKMKEKVLRDALRLANGEKARLQQVNPYEIIVHNNKNWRQRVRSTV